MPKGADLNEYFGLPKTSLTVQAKFETVLCPGFDEIILEETDEFIVKINHRGIKEKNFKSGDSMPEFQLDMICYHEDMAYKNGSLISPAMFKEFMSPYYARIQKYAKKYDIGLQCLDSDGNIWELIPLWLGFGINILLPMEVAAGMDVVALRKEFGRELRMIGGFDKRIMASKNKEDIRKELERIRPVIEDGGYIPALDHGAPPDIPFGNVCYYIDCLKRIFGAD